MKIVIFCGGFGTRMWPASRKSFPKQFYPILDGKSFFQITLDRFLKGFNQNDIFIATEKRYEKLVMSQALSIPKENIILEPERRDMLAAVGLVTATIHKKFPGEVMFFSWSDHIIKNEKKFLNAVKAAGILAARTEKPVSVDVEPAFPSVHNGWLQTGNKLDSINGFSVYEIKKHVEKPNLHTAKRMLKSNNYLIHTGYGAWKTSTILEYYSKYNPKAFKIIDKIIKSKVEKTAVKNLYPKLEKISIEYGLFEKIPSNERSTIPIDVGWLDAGTWQLFYEAFAKTNGDTVVKGNVDIKLLESESNLIVGKKNKLIAVIGLSNLTIIDTPDALLVCDLNQTKKEKDLYNILEKTKPKYIE